MLRDAPIPALLALDSGAVYSVARAKQRDRKKHILAHLQRRSAPSIARAAWDRCPSGGS